MTSCFEAPRFSRDGVGLFGGGIPKDLWGGPGGAVLVPEMNSRGPEELRCPLERSNQEYHFSFGRFGFKMKML